MRVRVALVDDHQLFRDGLRTLLNAQPEMEVVGEAADASSAYGTVDSTSPDVVVMDVALPGVSGIAAAREILRRDPKRRLMFLTMHAEEEFVVQGLSAGAIGYALKHQPASQVLEAIQDVARGQSYLCSRISRFIVDDHLRLRRGESTVRGPCDSLSPREKEVFDLLVRGFSNDNIGGQLCVSVKTVETHRAHILKKLRLHSMVELVRFAALHNLLYQ
jgi:two-component system response regulator NreC